MKSEKEKQLEIQLLTEKIQRISGKKVVLKEEVELDPEFKKELEEDGWSHLGFDEEGQLVGNNSKFGGNGILVFEVLNESAFSTLSNKSIILEEEKKGIKIACLNSDSKIDTQNPLNNEFVQNKTAYFLLKLVGNDKTIILSGSGKTEEYLKDNRDLYLFDDGNGTTKLPSLYNRKAKIYNPYYVGTLTKVLATANTPEEIKEFPKGKYQLYVMK